MLRKPSGNATSYASRARMAEKIDGLTGNTVHLIHTVQIQMTILI